MTESQVAKPTQPIKMFTKTLSRSVPISINDNNNINKICNVRVGLPTLDLGIPGLPPLSPYFPLPCLLPFSRQVPLPKPARGLGERCKLPSVSGVVHLCRLGQTVNKLLVPHKLGPIINRFVGVMCG